MTFCQLMAIAFFYWHEYLTNSRRGEFPRLEQMTRVGHRWCKLIIKLCKACDSRDGLTRLENECELGRQNERLLGDYETTKID